LGKHWTYIAIVGIEFGFLLTYRSGWNQGSPVLVNVVASLILVLWRF
jgi:hypothetical protein